MGASAQGKPSSSNFLFPGCTLESSREFYDLEMPKVTLKFLDSDGPRLVAGSGIYK